MKNYYGKEAERDVLTGINMNAYDFIDEATKPYEKYTAMTYFGKEISYADFKKKVNIYANKLKSYGLEKGDSISLLLGNTPEIVYYYYASWVLGVKVCPLDPRTNSDGIKDMINRCDCKLLIAILDKYQEKVSPIIDKINVDKVVIVSPTDSMGYSIKGTIGKAMYRYKEHKLNMVDKDFAGDKVIMNKNFLRGASDAKVQSVYEETPNGMPASCLFTSGTTGTPKAAVQSHESYNAKAKQIRYAFPNLLPADKFLGIIPFFSAYGGFAGMHNCLHKAVNIIMIPSFNPRMVPELICEYKPSSLIAVPNYWHDFGSRIDDLMAKYDITDLSFLKYPVSGGDKQPPQDVTDLNEIFRKHKSPAMLIRGYGSTEVGGPVATTVLSRDYEDREYTGIAFPGTDFKFCSPDTGKIDPNLKTGELAISDPSVMMEYLNDEIATSESVEEYNGRRYLKSGDLFSMDSQGRLHFQDRIKRAIMRPDGHTVHAVPIEDAITTSSLVDKCCVVGIRKTDGSAGSIPTAFVTLKDGMEGNEEIAKQLDEISLQYLSERNRALAYVFVDDIPMNSIGKSDYKKFAGLTFDDIDPIIVDDTFFDVKTKKLTK